MAAGVMVLSCVDEQPRSAGMRPVGIELLSSRTPVLAKLGKSRTKDIKAITSGALIALLGISCAVAAHAGAGEARDGNVVGQAGHR
jgi:hypothetical protein